jgi:hypothetical protein
MKKLILLLLFTTLGFSQTVEYYSEVNYNSSTLSLNNFDENETICNILDYKVYLKNNIIKTNYPEEISLCYIYDMMGRKVSNSIDVTNLSSGIYIVKLTIGKNIIITKIIKTN